MVGSYIEKLGKTHFTLLRKRRAPPPTLLLQMYRSSTLSFFKDFIPFLLMFFFVFNRGGINAMLGSYREKLSKTHFSSDVSQEHNIVFFHYFLFQLLI